MRLQDRIAIQNLRLEGYRPAKIAATLGLPASTVRSHIARHPDIPGTKVCQNCGKLMMQPKGRREKKFCSDACRMAWWNSHPEAVKKKAYYQLECKCCGKEFESYGNQNRKYCCRRCYLAARRG